MFCIGRLRISFFIRDLAIFAVSFCLVASSLRSVNAARAEAPKPSAKPAGAQPIPQAHKQGRLIVKFRQEATAEQRAFVLNIFAKDEKPLRGKSRLSKLILKDGLDVANAVFNARQFDNVVEYAEPDYIVTRSDASMQVLPTPNDPAFAQQWALANIGQNGGFAGADIGAQAAWQTTTGAAETIIAVIDTGIDASHPDLVRNLWVNKREANGKKNEDDDRDGYVDDLAGWNFANDTNNVADDHGRGTAVAGIIAAQGNNSVGVAGVMWKAGLMPLKALDATGSGAISDVVEAMGFATAHGAGVINCSFGTTGYSQALLDAINRAASSGALIVASAGNDSQNISQSAYYPAGYNAANLITVAATNNAEKAFLQAAPSRPFTIRPVAKMLSCTSSRTARATFWRRLGRAQLTRCPASFGSRASRMAVRGRGGCRRAAL